MTTPNPQTPDEHADDVQPSLRYWLIPVAVLLLCGALYGIYQLARGQVAAILTPPTKEKPEITATPLEDVKPRDYTKYGKQEESQQTVTPPIPQAQYVQKDRQAESPQTVAMLSAVQAQAAMMERLLTTLSLLQSSPTNRQETLSRQATTPQTTPAVQQAQTKKVTPIKFLIDNTTESHDTKKEEDDKQKDSLLEPAHHIRPLDKSKVLYRSQVLPGRLLTSLNSDIPGSVHIELTVPIYSAQAKPDDKPILDKGTKIIASYKGEIKFGQIRVPLQIEEAQPPNGDIIELKAIGGDEEGRTGVTGTVNNHYAKLALATGINAILQLGVKSLAGTPGQGQYFQNPVQQAAQEAGQSAAGDIGRVVGAQLKVPPTIEKDRNKDPFVTVLLEKNLSFYRSPKIVK